MHFPQISTLALVLALSVLLAAQAAQEGPDRGESAGRDRSRAALDAWLGRIPGSGAGRVAPVENEAVRRVFPAEWFYSVHFMRYPRAVIPPNPLKLDNVLGVSPDGSVKHLQNRDALTSYLREKLPPVRDAAEARNALLATLRLCEEFFQDGHYVFTVPDDSLSVAPQGDGRVAAGKAVVTKGGNGEITARLTFNASGKVDDIVLGGRVRPDVRNR
jgi:hypothetical protein